MHVSCHRQEVAVLKFLFFPGQFADSARHKSLITAVKQPYNGISEKEQADVDMAKADEEWGPNGETVREMIRNLYHCKADEEVNKYVRRYLAS